MNPSNKLSNEKTESNKVESKDIFDNIKVDYFLQKVFNNLERNISLKIVKYNKNIKKRLNININDYKEYSEIEIELKLVDDKSGEFINIPEEEKEYYHFY